MNTVGVLDAHQVRSVLRAAAPSRSVEETWRFHCTATAIELHADIPDTEPGARELLVACGAALVNLRLAIRALGVYPDVRVLPRAGAADLVAIVRPEGRRQATPADLRLAKAISAQPTDVPVPSSIPVRWRQAAESERAWLAPVTAQQLREITHHTDLLATHDGLDPLIVVIGSFQDLPASRIQAGQAMQRVLLTAGSAGLYASSLTRLLRTPSRRKEVRALLGGGLWPQAVLRFGQPTPLIPETSHSGPGS